MAGHRDILPFRTHVRVVPVHSGGVDALIMTTHTAHGTGTAAHRSFRLTPRELRTEQGPDVVIDAGEARALLAAAASQDVSKGGCFSPGPAGVQLWDGPWNGPGGRVGTARHLGSVDWSWDVPSAGLVTVYRVLLTAAGGQAGLTTHRLLEVVLGLAGPASAPLPEPRSSSDFLHVSRSA